MSLPPAMLLEARRAVAPRLSLRVEETAVPMRRSPLGTSPVELATLHALTWLVAANAVGLLLASLLLLPDLGRALGPLTYGRWVPVHLDLQLYGWCALPLVALLLRAYGADVDEGGARIAVHAWSSSLVVAAAAWLGGASSGKLFLEWTGAARFAFPASLLLLALTLGRLYLKRTPGAGRAGSSLLRRRLLLGALLLVLAPVPFILFWASGPKVYPPFNPDSGGATGTSLLGSSLGIVLVFCLAPLLAGLEVRRPRVLHGTLALLGLHFAAFVLVRHLEHVEDGGGLGLPGGGALSHHAPLQILALGSLLLWPLLLGRLYRRIGWPVAARPWLVALAAWGGLLVGTAFLTFLPGLLEAFKFTNVLVAHAHLAMAAMITSFDVLVLESVNRDTRLAGVFAARPAFGLWHGGCALLLGALVTLGIAEGSGAVSLFESSRIVEALYAVRWLGGAFMLAGSVLWLGEALDRVAARSREFEVEGAAA